MTGNNENSTPIYKCQNPKCLHSFQKKKNGPLGMYCSRKCKHMMFYINNREKTLQQRHDYYVKNKSKKCAWAKTYYINVAKAKRVKSVDKNTKKEEIFENI